MRVEGGKERQNGKNLCMRDKEGLKQRGSLQVDLTRQIQERV